MELGQDVEQARDRLPVSDWNSGMVFGRVKHSGSDWNPTTGSSGGRVGIATGTWMPASH